MSILGTVTQQPAERLLYGIDYSEYLSSGDTVVSATTAVTPDGLVVDGVTTSDYGVNLRVSSGVSGVRYKVEVTVTTSCGCIIQDELIFRIKEI